MKFRGFFCKNSNLWINRQIRNAGKKNYAGRNQTTRADAGNKSALGAQDSAWALTRGPLGRASWALRRCGWRGSRSERAGPWLGPSLEGAVEQEAGAGWAGSGAAGEAGALGCEGEGPRPMWGGRATRPAAPASSSRRTEMRPAARKAMRAGSGRGMAGGVWDGADPADPGRIHPFPVAAAAERLHGGGGYLREEGVGGVSTRSEGGEGEEVKVDGEAATWGGGLQGEATGSAAQIGRRGRASCSGDGDASESQAALGQAAARAGA